MTNASELQHLQQAANSAVELYGSGYYGHIECPRENLAALCARGALIADFNAFPGSLLARALVFLPAVRFAELAADGLVGGDEWHLRVAAEAAGVPSDLSLRTAAALESDLMFCRWHLAARTRITTEIAAVPSRIGSDCCFRIYDAPTYEIAQLERTASRVANELRKRESDVF